MKMTYNDMAYIFNYKKIHIFEKFCCTINTFKVSDTTYSVEIKTTPLVIILFFIPVNIINIFFCIWECGLKNFTLWKGDKTTRFLSLVDKKYSNSCINRYIEKGYSKKTI